MLFFNKNKSKKLIDKNSLEFVCFDDWLNDSSIVSKAKKESGCIIKSKNNNFQVCVCTGNGYDSLKLCVESLKIIFRDMIEKKVSFDKNMLVNKNWWEIQIFEKVG